MFIPNIKVLGLVVSEEVVCFHYVSQCKTFDPWRGGIFRPKNHNLNTLGRISLGDTTYKVSR